MNSDFLISVLIGMIFCHIADDFYLQGVLASMKQKAWWRGKAPEGVDEELYANDYLMALAAHCASWSSMMMLPIMIYEGFNVGVWFAVAWLANASAHFAIDTAKANKHTINLIIDQSLHILQILITFAVLCILKLYNIKM